MAKAATKTDRFVLCLLIASAGILFLFLGLPTRLIKTSADLLQDPEELVSHTYKAVDDLIKLPVPAGAIASEIEIGVIGEQSKTDYVAQADIWEGIKRSNLKALNTSGNDPLVYFLATKPQVKIGKATPSRPYRYFVLNTKSGNFYELSSLAYPWTNSKKFLKPKETIKASMLVIKLDSKNLPKIVFGTALNSFLDELELGVPFSIVSTPEDSFYVTLKASRIIDEPLQIPIIKKSQETIRLKKRTRRANFRSLSLASAIAISQRLESHRIIIEGVLGDHNNPEIAPFPNSSSITRAAETSSSSSSNSSRPGDGNATGTATPVVTATAPIRETASKSSSANTNSSVPSSSSVSNQNSSIPSSQHSVTSSSSQIIFVSSSSANSAYSSSLWSEIATSSRGSAKSLTSTSRSTTSSSLSSALFSNAYTSSPTSASSSPNKCYVCLYGTKKDDSSVNPEKDCDKAVAQAKKEGYEPAIKAKLMNEETGLLQGSMCYCTDPKVDIIAHGDTECSSRAFNIAQQIIEENDGKINSCGIYDWGCSAYGTVCEAQAAGETLHQYMAKIGLSPEVYIGIKGHQTTHIPYRPGITLAKLKALLMGYELKDFKDVICSSNSTIEFAVCAKGVKTNYPACKAAGSDCARNNPPKDENGNEIDDGQDYYPDCMDGKVLSTQTCKDFKWTGPKPKNCTK